MVILKSSTPANLKAKNDFVISLVKKLRVAKLNAEKRLASSTTNEDKDYYQGLIEDYTNSIQSAIECYITVY